MGNFGSLHPDKLRFRMEEIYLFQNPQAKINLI